jgi:hypothetical protein
VANTTGAQAGNYLSIFGSILDSIGAVYSGYLENSVAKYNIKISEAQSALVESNIRYRTSMTDIGIEQRTSKARKDMRIIEGEQVAGYAGAGVKLTGSPIDVMLESRKNSELDLALLNLNDRLMTNQQNITDTVTSAGYKAQGMLYKAAGSQALAKGFASATKSLLSGMTNYKSPSVLGNETIGGGRSLYEKVGSDYSIGSRRW